jgi:hypothetical protein
MEGVTMTSAQDFAQLQLHFVDQIQWRYELIEGVSELWISC